MAGYWNMIINVLITAVASGVIGFAVAKWKENNSQSEAIKCMLRYNILTMAEKCILQGYITRYELETLHSMNSAYKCLGGNSFIKDIMHKIGLLRIVEPQESK